MALARKAPGPAFSAFSRRGRIPHGVSPDYGLGWRTGPMFGPGYLRTHIDGFVTPTSSRRQQLLDPVRDLVGTIQAVSDQRAD